MTPEEHKRRGDAATALPDALAAVGSVLPLGNDLK
jgi:hypothetical protein